MMLCPNPPINLDGYTSPKWEVYKWGHDHWDAIAPDDIRATGRNGACFDSWAEAFAYAASNGATR